MKQGNILWAATLIVATASAFTTRPNTFNRHVAVLASPSDESQIEMGNAPSASASNHRRQFLGSLATAILPYYVGVASVSADEGSQTTVDGEGVIMYKTSSGLKYIELEPPSDPSSKITPRYGQLCIFSYKAYLKLPNGKEKEQFDTCSSYITKHGNGRILPGLDEGLHTMKVGSLRRIIIPPKLGFVQSGLGPLPEYPWQRAKLNRLLEQMITQRGGNLVYDVRLEKILDDEADQGYYDDLELSAEELDEIQRRLNRPATPAAPQEAAMSSPQA